MKLSDLFDPVRKKFVKATPEECVRQALIKKMLEELHYPLHSIVVEIELSRLPHIPLHERACMAKRRADVLVVEKSLLFGFSPIFLIECKAVPITDQMIQQVVGYNTFVGARYIAIVNGERSLTGSFDLSSGQYRFCDGLPSYEAVCSM